MSLLINSYLLSYLPPPPPASPTLRTNRHTHAHTHTKLHGFSTEESFSECKVRFKFWEACGHEAALKGGSGGWCATTRDALLARLSPSCHLARKHIFSEQGRKRGCKKLCPGRRNLLFTLWGLCQQTLQRSEWEARSLQEAVFLSISPSLFVSLAGSSTKGLQWMSSANCYNNEDFMVVQQPQSSLFCFFCNDCCFSDQRSGVFKVFIEKALSWL